MTETDNDRDIWSGSLRGHATALQRVFENYWRVQRKILRCNWIRDVNNIRTYVLPPGKTYHKLAFLPSAKPHGQQTLSTLSQNGGMGLGKKSVLPSV